MRVDAEFLLVLLPLCLLSALLLGFAHGGLLAAVSRVFGAAQTTDTVQKVRTYRLYKLQALTSTQRQSA